ncbi:PEGA domain-containing protein [candidate division KSB1 bacterium]|nr:PEGA domain-containing protein [candidate division KSB1 bacterium]
MGRLFAGCFGRRQDICIYPGIKAMTRILVIILTFAASLSAQTGYLKIDTPDSGLVISINDSAVTKTPVQPLNLLPGDYDVIVTNPKKGFWRYNDWTRTVTIEPTDTTVIQPQFSLNVIIRTTPFDARVYLNNEYIGSTPLYYEIADPENAVFMIKKSKYRPETIAPDTIESAAINIDLKPIADQRSPVLQRSSKNQTISSNKKFIYSLFAFTIASGFTAAYLKDRADKKYNQYLSTASLQKMNEYYEDSKMLDTYSSISLGMFEVSFAVSLYYLIKKSEY